MRRAAGQSPIVWLLGYHSKIRAAEQEQEGRRQNTRVAGCGRGTTPRRRACDATSEREERGTGTHAR
jgi:hypothetical protein